MYQMRMICPSNPSERPSGQHHARDDIIVRPSAYPYILYIYGYTHGRTDIYTLYAANSELCLTKII